MWVRFAPLLSDLNTTSQTNHKALLLEKKKTDQANRKPRNQEKRIGQLKKYPNQPVVGFRYVGMSWSSYFEGDQQPQKLSMQKSWGAGMAVENTGSGLARWVWFCVGSPLGSRNVKLLHCPTT